MLALIVSLQPLPKPMIQPTPPMGWNGWNQLGPQITEDIVKHAADRMVEMGLSKAGYEYIILDDGLTLRSRDAGGHIVYDGGRFPNGMKVVADYVHSKGLKFGLTTSAGKRTCSENVGIFGYEEVDAADFTAMGVDYLKVGLCYNPLVAHHYIPDFLGLQVNGTTYGIADAELTGSAQIMRDAIVYVGDANGEATFTINVAQAGTYLANMTYRHSDDYRPMQVSVNGGEPQPYAVVSTYTADRGYFGFNLSLKAGANRVTFKMDMDD